MHFQFTTLLKAHNKIREFNFTSLSFTATPLFEVAVCDDRGTRISFQMKKEGEQGWQLPQELEGPEWIREVKGRLGQELEQPLQ